MWLRPLVSHFFFLNEQTINLFLQLEHFIKTASSMALFLCSFPKKKKKKHFSTSAQVMFPKECLLHHCKLDWQLIIFAPLVSHFFFLTEQTINLFLQLEHFIKISSSMALFLCSFHQKKKKLLNQCTSNVSKRVLTPSLQIGLTVNYLCINPYHWGTRGLSIQAKATMLW